MRKICVSLNTAPTASLIRLALARSRPIGFSSTTRDWPRFSPCSPRRLQMSTKSSGEVDR